MPSLLGHAKLTSGTGKDGYWTLNYDFSGIAPGKYRIRTEEDGTNTAEDVVTVLHRNSHDSNSNPNTHANSDTYPSANSNAGVQHNGEGRNGKHVKVFVSCELVPALARSNHLKKRNFFKFGKSISRISMSAGPSESLTFLREMVVEKIKQIHLELTQRVETAKMTRKVRELGETMKSGGKVAVLGGRGFSLIKGDIVERKVLENHRYEYEKHRDRALDMICKDAEMREEFILDITEMENSEIPRVEHFILAALAREGFVTAYVTTNYTNEAEKACVLMGIPYSRASVCVETPDAPTVEAGKFPGRLNIYHVNGDIRSLVCHYCGRSEYLPTVLSPRREYEIVCHCGNKSSYKPTLFPADESRIDPVYDAAKEELRSADVVLVCGWSGKYDEDLVDYLRPQYLGR